MIERSGHMFNSLSSMMDSETLRLMLRLHQTNPIDFPLSISDDVHPNVSSTHHANVSPPMIGPNLPMSVFDNGSNQSNSNALCSIIDELRDVGRNDIASQVVMLLLSSLECINGRSGSFATQPNYLEKLLSRSDSSISLHSITPSLLQNIHAEKVSLQKQNSISPIDCPQEIIFNHGIALLGKKRPRDAFINFMTILNSQNWNPRIWAYLAECCIMYKEMSLAKVSEAQIESSEFLLPPSAGLNMHYAELCLKNALKLLQAYWDRVADENGYILCDLMTDKQNICSPLEPFPKVLLTSTLCFVYLALSYVYMRLGHFNNAYKMATEVFKLKRVGKGQKMLAHLYAAEALLLLDNLGEHCELKMIPCLGTFDQQMNYSKGLPPSIMHFNLAVSAGLQGNLTSAVNLVSDFKNPKQAPAGRFLRHFTDVCVGKF